MKKALMIFFMCLPIQGYRIFQLKLGGDLNQNVDQIRACRSVMDSKDTLIGDANGGKSEFLCVTML